MIEVGLTGVCIDAFEVTWTGWAEFMNAHGSNECLLEGFEDWDNHYQCYSEGALGSYVTRASDGTWEVVAGYEQYPAAWVTYVGARLACEQWGKRLCSFEEWAQACEGPDGNLYPYGDTYEPFTCNACSSSETSDCTSYPKTDAVGGFPDCEGGYPGLFDMSGNVEEWAMDYRHYSRNTAYSVMGGDSGADSTVSQCRNDYTLAGNPYLSYEELGFRCCFYLD
jgi:formylglycine-generating enzyme required for sulfatase activity